MAVFVKKVLPIKLYFKYSRGAHHLAEEAIVYLLYKYILLIM